jgi:phospholipase/lecithinase/hemolysin
MGDYKNLSSEDAVSKLKKLAEDIRVCMFCTDLTHAPFFNTANERTGSR